MQRFFTPAAILATLFFGASAVIAQEAQTPGKEHEELKALEGTWDASMKMSDGTEMKAVSEFRMTCGGMWLESDFRGEIGGQAFHGKGLDSYDATRKLYVSVWVDSMSGTPMVLTGKKEGKVITMSGEGAGPAGLMKYKTISTNESADKMSFQMFMVSDGKDVELMTVKYTRRKK